MNKKLSKAIATVLLVVLTLVIFPSCGIISVNADRNMDQVLATVSIKDGVSEDIRKRELVMAYNTYGYVYEQYLGYKRADVLSSLLTNLVNERITAQYAKLALTSGVTAGKAGYFTLASQITEEKTPAEQILSMKNYLGNDFSTLTYSSETEEFLTEYEYAYERYVFLSEIEDLIQSYVEEDGKPVKPSKVRATLSAVSGDANEWNIRYDEEKKKIPQSYLEDITVLNGEYGLELDVGSYESLYDLNLDFYKAYARKFDYTSTARVEAMKDAMRSFNNLGYVTTAECEIKINGFEDLMKIDVFKTDYLSNCNDIIVAKFQTALLNEKKKELSGDTAELFKSYGETFTSQRSSYTGTGTTYKNALSSTSTLVVAHAGSDGVANEYGYVAYCLIGFDEGTKTDVTKYASRYERKPEQVQSFRNAKFKELKAKDLRATWVQASYGAYNVQEESFAFRSRYCRTEELKTYFGTLKEAYPYTNENGWTTYGYTEVTPTEMTFKEFYDDVVSPIMGFEKSLLDDDGLSDGTVKKIECEPKTDEYGAQTLDDVTLQKFRDITFAFSGDDNSLNETLGYLYAPEATVADDKKEFDEGAGKVVKNGVGSYAVIATNSGYYLMLCTKTFVGTEESVTDDVFIDSLGTEGALSTQYLDYKAQAAVKTVTDAVTTNFYGTLKGKVERFESRYSDLLG